MAFSIYELFDDLPAIHIVDVGASPVDGLPPYQPLIDVGKAEVVAFEPNPEEYGELQKSMPPFTTLLPYAIGDGQEATLNICYAPGMTSVLEPNMEVLEYFHDFAKWGQVVRREKVATLALDDVEEIKEIDYLKLDVQGSELKILQHAPRTLAQTLVVHTEVQFVPFYKGQPLFAELDQALRQAGFYLHRFTPLVSRLFKPLMLHNDVFAGLSQVLWSDAVYVRKFTDFASMPSASLVKIAVIVHELYGSFDMANLALRLADEKEGTGRKPVYLKRLQGQK